MGVPFVDCSDVLFIDRALAVQVPYDAEDSDIVPHTVSTAQKHGWIWILDYRAAGAWLCIFE